jgi:hypothetical protein
MSREPRSTRTPVVLAGSSENVACDTVDRVAVKRSYPYLDRNRSVPPSLWST